MDYKSVAKARHPECQTNWQSRKSELSEHSAPARRIDYDRKYVTKPIATDDYPADNDVFYDSFEY